PATAPPQTYTLSLHDALPILAAQHLDPAARRRQRDPGPRLQRTHAPVDLLRVKAPVQLAVLAAQPRRHRRPRVILLGRRDPIEVDRKSTRLNSSHVSISYAVF